MREQKTPLPVLEIGVDGARDTMRIQTVAIGVVKLIASWIVHEQCVGVGATANNNAVHRVSLMFGTSHLAIFVVMKVTDGE